MKKTHVLILLAASALWFPLRGAATVYGPYLDASGQIETRIYFEGRGGGYQYTVSVEVAPEDVLVGGGAFVGGVGFLTGSYPNLDKTWTDGTSTYPYGTKWVGTSRYHTWFTKHSLFVYAIGMRLKKNSPLNTYMSRAEMLKYIRYTSALSGYAAHPSAIAYRPEGFSMIGGGAKVYYPTAGAGSLLTHSCGVPRSDDPLICDGWYAASKDHVTSSPNWIVSYAISVITNNGLDWYRDTPSIPGFGNFNIRWHRTGTDYPYPYYPTTTTNMWQTGTATVRAPNDGIIDAQYWKTIKGITDTRDSNLDHLPYIKNGQRNNLPVTWNLVGVGGKVTSNTEYGWGRLLTGLYFNYDGFSGVGAFDRDHVYPDYGTLDVEYFSVTKDAGYALFGPCAAEVNYVPIPEDE